MVSGGQQGDTAGHRHVLFLPQTLLLSKLPYNLSQSSLCYTFRFSLITAVYTAVYICQSQAPNSSHSTFPLNKWTEDRNRHCTKEDIQIAKRYMERGSIMKKRKSNLQRGITSPQAEGPSRKILQITNAGEKMDRMWRRESSYTVGGNVN